MAGRDFRRLLGVRLISQGGDGLFQAALAGSLLFNPQQATSATEVATGFAVLLLPYSIIGPYVGVILDRWSRRTVIYAANLIRAAVVVPTALLIWFGHESWLYVCCALLIIGINRLFLAGLSASQPHVVAGDRMVTANALAGTLGTLVYSLGLGVAALLLNEVLRKSFHGYAVLSTFAIVGYVGSALLARFSFTRQGLGPDETEQHTEPIGVAIVEIARGMVAGARHLRSRRGAAYAMLAQAAHRGLYGVLALATLLLYRHYFYGENESRALAGLAEVVIAGGFGSLLAAIVTPRVTRAIGGWRWITLLLAGSGIMIFLLGLPFRALLLVLATFFINIASQGMKIVVDTALQRQCDDEFQGRVFSVNDTAYNLSFVLGLFIAASTLPANGKSSMAIVLVAAGYLVVACWYAVAARSIRRTPVPVG